MRKHSRMRRNPRIRRHPRERKEQRGKTAPSAPPAISFGGLLRQLAGESGASISLGPEPSPLAGLPYETELDLKNRTLRRFWEMRGLPDQPSRIVPSPAPRRYRSTSKRTLVRRTHWEWDFFQERAGGAAADPWILETPAHEAIYRKALEKLREGPYQGLARNLNYLIVRGDKEQMILFNLHHVSAEMVRKARLLSDHLAGIPEAKVVGAQLFRDASGSTYYLEAAAGPNRLKRFFGPEYLSMEVSGRRYFLPPAGFFQVNPSLLPRLVEETIRSLKPQTGDRVLDLFCGCGLFTLPAAGFCREVFGVEWSGKSIAAAVKAAHAAGIRNARFVAGKIEAAKLPRLLPPPGTDFPEVILLDPPRQGTPPGLIPELARRKPRRVVHLFCDMNVMPVEIEKWRKHGYMVAKVAPLDMFPGTDNLEVLVLLLPDRFGLLGGKPRSSPALTDG